MHSAKAGKRQTAWAERSLPISCPSLVASLVLKAKLCIPQLQLALSSQGSALHWDEFGVRRFQPRSTLGTTLLADGAGEGMVQEWRRRSAGVSQSSCFPEGNSRCA